MRLGKEIGLEETKSIMLQMLKEFIEFCQNHNLTYFVYAGTLLGAVRHKGYIPWDDDIDLAMPLSDYDRFIELTKQTPIAPNLYVSSFKYNKDHVWPMAKVINTDTYLVEPNITKRLMNKQKSYSGIYLDIFPLYGVPDSKEAQQVFSKKMRNTFVGFMRAVHGINRRPNEKSLHYAIRTIPTWFFRLPYRIRGYQYYLRRFEKLSRVYAYEKQAYCASDLGMSYDRDINEKSCFSDFVLLDFEDMKCKAPIGYEACLTNLYGDYMQLPPEDERVTHPREVFHRTKDL